jgi:hypothetical protein
MFAERESIYPVEWLQERITAEEAERMQTHAQWETLRASMQPGDELWTFASPAESWQRLAGRSGIALVRNKKSCAQLLRS